MSSINHTLVRKTPEGSEKHYIETGSDVCVRPNGKTVEQSVSVIEATIAAVVGQSLPVGTIMMWGGQVANIPAKWKLCNGELLTTSAYAALFNTVGGSFGGDGITTFMLPDLRNRFITGAGDQYTVGSKAGVDVVTLSSSQMPTHSHTATGNTSTDSLSGTTGAGGGHSHTIPDFGPVNAAFHNTNLADDYQGVAREYYTAGSTDTKPDHTHTISGTHSHTVSISTSTVGMNTPHENRPPYFALCYIIYTGV